MDRLPVLKLWLIVPGLFHSKPDIPSTSPLHDLLPSNKQSKRDSQRLWVRSFTLRVTGLTVEDNYDGAVGKFGKGNNLTDAVQVTALIFFRTSANHELRFTVNYELYDLLAFGYTVDHTETRSFNITQNIV